MIVSKKSLYTLSRSIVNFGEKNSTYLYLWIQAKDAHSGMEAGPTIKSLLDYKVGPHPIAAHACLAASSFANFWLLPTPMPFSTPFTLQKSIHIQGETELNILVHLTVQVG